MIKYNSKNNSFEELELAEMLKSLAHPSRICIIRLVCESGNDIYDS